MYTDKLFYPHQRKKIEEIGKMKKKEMTIHFHVFLKLFSEYYPYGWNFWWDFVNHMLDWQITLSELTFNI